MTEAYKRCGMCGVVINTKGNAVNVKMPDSALAKLELDYCNDCYIQAQREGNMHRVTKEMAMDAGVSGDPCRLVFEYWSLDGALLSVKEPQGN